MDSELLIRALAFCGGAVGAGHYFLGAVALKKAAAWEKLVLFPGLVMSCTGVCVSSAFYGLAEVAQACVPVAALVLVKDLVIWRAGAYMSDVLDRRERVREAERQAFNRLRADLMAPYESVADLVTPSGFDELQASEQKGWHHEKVR